MYAHVTAQSDAQKDARETSVEISDEIDVLPQSCALGLAAEPPDTTVPPCRTASLSGPADMLGPSRQTTVQGTTIAWTEMGEGEPLVLLHGMGDSHRTWRQSAHHLAQDFRVLMPDLPGHGLSGRPDAPYTLAWYAQSVLDWMSAVGVESAHVCGHSFGGGIAQWMLLCDASRVRSLALVAAGGLGREVAFGLRLAAIPGLGPLLTPHFMAFGTRAMMQQISQESGDLDPDEIDRAVWMNKAPGTGRAFQRTVKECVDLLGQHAQTWAHIDSVEHLPPIALFWGMKDRTIPVRHCHLGARRLHNVKVFTYPESGHFLHLENAAGFAGDLVAFLRQPGPAATLRQPRSSGLPGLHDVPSRIADAVALRARRAMHAWHSPTAERSKAS